MKSLRFESKNAAIANLVIRQLPSHRATNIAKAIRDGYASYMLGANGSVYTDSRISSPVRRLERQSVAGLYPLRACVTLGALSQADYDEHESVVRKIQTWRDADAMLWEIRRIAETHTLKVPKAWVKKLSKPTTPTFPLKRAKG